MAAVFFSGGLASPVSAGADTLRAGLVELEGSFAYRQKDGGFLASAWKTIGNRRCYFDAHGRAVRGRAMKIGGQYWIFDDGARLLVGKRHAAAELKSGTYAVNAEGHPLYTGFRVSSGKLRHYAKNGRLTCGKAVDGVSFNEDGIAKSDNASKLKIAIMKKVGEITKGSWSKGKKLSACWRWVRAHKYSLSRGGYLGGTFPYGDIGRQGWVQRCALRVMKTNETACYGYACTFAMFAHELGYKAVVWAAADSPKKPRYHHGYAIVAGKRWDNIASHPKVKHKHRYEVLSYSRIRGVIKGPAGKGTDAGSEKTGWNAAGTRLKLGNGSSAAGPVFYKGKLYLFDSRGLYQADRTALARKAARKNKPCARLLEILGKPRRTFTIGLCAPVPGKAGGKNRAREWKNMVLTTYVDRQGTEYFQSFAAR